MPAEGMVHALHRSSHLIAAAGSIVDLHPTPATAVLDAILDSERIVELGELHADEARDRHARADAALAEAVGRGLFSIAGASTFTFRRVSDSIDELIAFVSGKWNGTFAEPTVARARAASRDGGLLSLREEVAISALRTAGGARCPACT